MESKDEAHNPPTVKYPRGYVGVRDQVERFLKYGGNVTGTFGKPLAGSVFRLRDGKMVTRRNLAKIKEILDGVVGRSVTPSRLPLGSTMSMEPRGLVDDNHLSWDEIDVITSMFKLSDSSRLRVFKYLQSRVGIEL